jgi:hypothetical protein
MSSSCSIEKGDMDLQKKVMNDVFESIVDSIHTDYRIPLAPPPPYPDETEKNDSTQEDYKFNRALWVKEYHNKLDSIRLDSSKLKIAISDTISDIRKRYLFEELESLKTNLNDWDTSSTHSDYRIDLLNFEESEFFRFVYRSDLPADRINWYEFEVFELIGFSTIVFDKSKTQGVLSVWTSCGRLCGSGFLVFIKKKKDNWLVDEIKLTSIS